MAPTFDKDDAGQGNSPLPRAQEVPGIHFDDLKIGARVLAMLYNREWGADDPWRRAVLLEVLSRMTTQADGGIQTYKPPMARISIYEYKRRQPGVWRPLGGTPGIGRVYTLFGTRLYEPGADIQKSLPTIPEPFMLQTNGPIEVIPKDAAYLHWVGGLLVDKLSVRYPLYSD